jgi:hypothetical protein
MKRLAVLLLLACSTASCAAVLGIDDGLPLPDDGGSESSSGGGSGGGSGDVGAPDAVPDSGGTEAGSPDAGGGGHDSGNDVGYEEEARQQADSPMTQDAANESPPVCMLGSTFSCASSTSSPPDSFCETGSVNTASVTTPSACSTCETYNCACMMAAFQAGGSNVCINYAKMACNDANGQVAITCSN